MRKDSSYLARCSESDFDERKTYLLSLNTHMPQIKFVGDRIMEMNFVEGNDDLALLNFGSFGEIVYQLHALKMDGPQKDTNIKWLLDLTTKNLKVAGLDGNINLYTHFSSLHDNAVVHGEIAQVVTDENGKLFILDWDECGISNRYQDLGIVYYMILEKGLASSCYDTFVESYADDSVDESVVKSVAGLVSLAYASFYDYDRRMELGKNLLTESYWEK